METFRFDAGLPAFENGQASSGLLYSRGAAATVVALAPIPEERGLAIAGTGTEPLSDAQRRRILIAAAAAAVLGAPVRVLDVRPAAPPPNRWVKAARVKRDVPRVGARRRRPAYSPLPASPGAEEEESSS